jgi:hypothetical protein
VRKLYTFAPAHRLLGGVPGVRPIAELAEEVGMYSASPDFVRRNGGPIANQILDSVPPSWFEECEARGLVPNIDVRVHRLYPGDYPAFPGWHCDGEFRETYFSQPDLDRVPVSGHMVATVASHESGVSRTEWLNEAYDFFLDKVGEGDQGLWAQVDKKLNAISENHRLWTTSYPPGSIVSFDSRTLHRATATAVRGWRLFFRMSQWHKPGLGPDSEGRLAKQEQIYRMVGPTGW